MVKSKRTGCKTPSRRRLRPKPSKSRSSKPVAAKNVITKDCMENKDYENAICSVCMESPHNAVLLLCSSYDKGCRPYMCGTSFRYSNCLDLYKNASVKLKSSSNHKSEAGYLTCPLCRGQVKGWTVVKAARDYMNLKKRVCMQENCVFAGSFKELRKHMRTEHPCAKPRVVDPSLEQNWRRLEVEHDRDDVMSTLMSALPGSRVLGDYVIEWNDDNGDANGGGINADLGRDLVNVAIMLHAVVGSGNYTMVSDSDTEGVTINHRTSETMNGEVERDSSNSLVSRMRRQGRILLSRSDRRRRDREANENSGLPPR